MLAFHVLTFHEITIGLAFVGFGVGLLTNFFLSRRITREEFADPRSNNPGCLIAIWCSGIALLVCGIVGFLLGVWVKVSGIDNSDGSVGIANGSFLSLFGSIFGWFGGVGAGVLAIFEGPQKRGSAASCWVSEAAWVGIDPWFSCNPLNY